MINLWTHLQFQLSCAGYTFIKVQSLDLNNFGVWWHKIKMKLVKMVNNNNAPNCNPERKQSSCPIDSPLNVGLRGTVISQVWWKVLLVLIYTVLVCVLNIFVPMDFTPALVPILGVVTGFLLVFRTNTAYDRYYEGRKVWTEMTLAVRRLVIAIWVSINDHDPAIVAEKKSVINCVVAYPIAVKHYLREEYSYDYDDLKSLIGHLPAFKNKLNHSAVAPAKNLRRATRKFSHLYTGPNPQSNIPLELVHCIAIYVKSLISRKLCDPSVIFTMNSGLTALVEDLGSFERILRTPLPIAYSVHLHQALWIHILSLPFQLISTLGWWTLPAVGFTSFTLLGILEIGWEIENPFGYDDNDLPLDDFCESTKKEADALMQSKIRTFEDLFHTSDTHSSESACITYNNRLSPYTDEEYAELSAQTLEEVTIGGNRSGHGVTNLGFTFVNTKF